MLPALRQAVAGVVGPSPARRPAAALLFGGSIGVTLAYIAALACAMSAFDSGVSFAQVGAVYLGASLIAAAAPTPGGLGAMEAALVAGFTGVGMDAGDRRRRCAQLPPRHVLVADPARLALLPSARSARLHLSRRPCLSVRSLADSLAHTGSPVTRAAHLVLQYR